MSKNLINIKKMRESLRNEDQIASTSSLRKTKNDNSKEFVDAKQMIQLNTFTNFFNYEYLTENEKLLSLIHEFANGVRIIRLIENIQRRSLNYKIFGGMDLTFAQRNKNIQVILDALCNDGVQLINIDSSEIARGNVSTILMLCWEIIQHYHLSKCGRVSQTKALMAWLQCALPELHLTNFCSNWRDGIALSALIDYCQPGLFPQWRHLNFRNRFYNCEKALIMAERYLRVPAIISAHHLSSDDLDEPSCVTYLSYFTRFDGPGYRATLRNIRILLNDVLICNFDNSVWNDGYLLGRLFQEICGKMLGFESMVFNDPRAWRHNVERVLNAISATTGIVSLVDANEIVHGDPTEYMGILTLCAVLLSLRKDDFNVYEFNLRDSPSSMTIKSTESYTKIMDSVRIRRKTEPKNYLRNRRVVFDLILMLSHRQKVLARDIDLIILDPNGRELNARESEIIKSESEYYDKIIVSFVPKRIGTYLV